MTGLKLSKKADGKEITAKEFYNKCINNKLKEKEFEFSADGTTNLKLDVLPSIINKNLSAKMVGESNALGLKLYTEKLVGNTNACMGFIKEKKRGRYVPNTVLQGNIKDITVAQMAIVATYRKTREEKKYNECTYKSKNIDIKNVIIPEEYSYLIEIQ